MVISIIFKKNLTFNVNIFLVIINVSITPCLFHFHCIHKTDTTIPVCCEPFFLVIMNMKENN